MRLTLLPFMGLFFIISCGKKAPPQPPPPPTKVKPSKAPSKREPIRGVGGYFIGNDGIVALYWDFPLRAEHFEVYLFNKKVGATGDNFFVYPKPLKRGNIYTFTVWAIRGEKRVGKVEIEVKP
jgi:hypothetical protein